MSHKSVEIVVGRLTTDEALRTRFSADPPATLRVLRETGLDLSPAEISALLQMPVEVWSVMASWIHPRLQKVALEGDRHEP